MSNEASDDLSLALAELAASTRGHCNDEIVPAGERACPICGAAMDVIQQHGVTIDVCGDHGVWLDQGELATLLERVYWHRRESEQRPQRDSMKNIDDTRTRFAAGVRRVAAMVSRSV